MSEESEQKKLVTENNGGISYNKSDCSFCLMILFPAWACIIFGYIMLSLVILNQLQDFKDIHDKNITVIEPWANGTRVVYCSPVNPCFVTCYDFVYRSEECEFSFIWIIISGIILGTCSCVLFCQICKYSCAYICFKKNTTTSNNSQYGRV